MTTTQNNVAAQAGDEPMPCPFCGFDESSVESYSVQSDNFHSAYVQCDQCDARGPNALTVDGWLPSKEEAIAEAIKAWNRIAMPEPEPTEAYWAVAANGARCAFGRYGFAKAWAGKNGTVETVQLRQFTRIEPEVSPRATTSATEALQVCVKALEFRKERSANDEFALNLARIALTEAPRATADVERDAARYQWLRHGDNDELVLQRGPIAPDYVYLPRNAKLDEMIDAHIATTKPGA